MTTTTMHLRSPGELITAIPYILAFEPTDSLVAIALKDGRVGLTSRIDLPDPGKPDTAVEALMPALRRDAPEQVILIAYEGAPGSAQSVLDAFAAALKAAGIGIRDRLLVTNGRWRSLECTNSVCCPPEGTPLDRDETATAVASEFIGQGIGPLPDRAALAAQLEPTDKAKPVGRLLDRPGPRRVLQPRVVGGLWGRILDPDEDPPEIMAQDASWAARTLRDVDLRDGIIAWLTPGTLKPEELPDEVQAVLKHLGPAPHASDDDPGVDLRLRSRLIQLGTLLPDSHAAPALTVLAAHAWWHGNGALARVALDRALRCDRDYRLALPHRPVARSSPEEPGPPHPHGGPSSCPAPVSAGRPNPEEGEHRHEYRHDGQPSLRRPRTDPAGTPWAPAPAPARHAPGPRHPPRPPPRSRGLGAAAHPDASVGPQRQPHPRPPRHKLWPRRKDRAVWPTAMDDAIPAYTGSADHPYLKARRFFADSVREAVTGVDGRDRTDDIVDALLDLFKLVVIDLEENDDAQVIFEVLNGRQTPLSASDLVKNLLFLRGELADEHELEQLYDTYWADFDEPWWKQQVGIGHAARGRRDVLLSVWLTATSGAEASVAHLYGEVRRYLAENNRKTEDILTELAAYGHAYKTIYGELPAESEVLVRATGASTGCAS